MNATTLPPEFDPLVLDLADLDAEALVTAGDVAERFAVGVAELPEADGTRALAAGISRVIQEERILRAHGLHGPRVIMACLDGDAATTLASVAHGAALLLGSLDGAPGSEVLAVVSEATGREIRRRGRGQETPIPVDQTLN